MSYNDILLAIVIVLLIIALQRAFSRIISLEFIVKDFDKEIQYLYTQLGVADESTASRMSASKCKAKSRNTTSANVR